MTDTLILQVRDENGTLRDFGLTTIPGEYGLRTADSNVLKRFGAVSGTPFKATTGGNTPQTLYTPPNAKSARLHWLAMALGPNVADCEATITLGGLTIFQWPLYTRVPAFSHSTRRDGPVDGLLQISLNVPSEVYVNFDVTSF